MPHMGPYGKMTSEDKKYRAEDDLRTLRRAEEVKADKSRVKAAQSVAKSEIKALAKISGTGSKSSPKRGKK